ncbi:mRNA 3'-end-processing protein RNA14-like [Anneissia japonica]|uniref:mRNA 3'-end-processing protein RNA14-like n=1 Tax=Anneissia japonica TaxID=1529436 RepID=UPI0014255ED0|nr:mRNA 3'-end-processing protein RNA14-like [Anneissia japonica]
MKIVKKLLGIGLLFLILQQCVVSQEEGTDDAAAAAADADTAAAADVDTAAPADDDTAAAADADTAVAADDDTAAAADDDTAADDAAAVEPETEEAAIDAADVPVCNQSSNEECIEYEHCCPGYECNHENKKCESDGSNIVLNPDDGEEININNDIIE